MEGYLTEWSTGATESSIEVDEAGTYIVTLTDETGCSFESDPVVIDVLETVTPEIDFTGQLGFCEGGSVVLSGPDNGEYTWNVGVTEQSIQVSNSGEFQLDFTDICGNTATSELVEVNVYDYPEVPVTTDVTIENPADVDLSATGNNLLWYDAEDALFPIGAGPDYPVFVDQTTTFWVESESVNDGTIATGAKEWIDEENGQFHQNNGFWLVFDAYQNLSLESVKVYADGLEARTFALVDANGATLSSSTFVIEDGENTVELNWFVPAGQGYGLRVTSDNPQLWRDGIGSDPEFPYALGNFGAITGTTVNGANSQSYYYFFYDWKVSVDAVGCASERVPLTVTVTNPSSVGTIAGLNSIDAYPNPTAGALALDLDLGANVLDLQVDVLDLQGRAVHSATWSGQATGRRNLDLGNLAPGHYTVRLTDGQGQWRLPVVRN